VTGDEQSAGPRRVRLVELPAPAIASLAAGDLTGANETAPIPLTPYFVEPESRSVWRRRRDQIAANPESAVWITRAVWAFDRQVAVGRAGFHGPPDADGMVEVGYGIDPFHRRQGYARAALAALLDRAAREPAIHTVRATITPDNTASRSLVAQYGFVAVGEQWDDEDGLEIVYEIQIPSVVA
jgi:RimJ/RimL family protein N-acetyltransferase